jgi:hypothetical protein
MGVSLRLKFGVRRTERVGRYKMAGQARQDYGTRHRILLALREQVILVLISSELLVAFHATSLMEAP